MPWTKRLSSPRYWSSPCPHSPLGRGSECWQETLPLQTTSSGRRTGRGCLRTLWNQSTAALASPTSQPSAFSLRVSRFHRSLNKRGGICASLAPYGLMCMCWGIICPGCWSRNITHLADERKQNINSIHSLQLLWRLSWSATCWWRRSTFISSSMFSVTLSEMLLLHSDLMLNWVVATTLHHTEGNVLLHTTDVKLSW